jgi:hypothetical protein
VDLDVDGIRGAPLSLSNSITCTATASMSTSNSRSRFKSRSQNRDSHAKMEFLKNYAALGCQTALLLCFRNTASPIRRDCLKNPTHRYNATITVWPGRGAAQDNSRGRKPPEEATAKQSPEGAPEMMAFQYFLLPLQGSCTLRAWTGGSAALRLAPGYSLSVPPGRPVLRQSRRPETPISEFIDQSSRP